MTWEDAPDDVSRRVVMVNIFGDTGTGRTRLALTAPGPIALAHTAEKIDGVVQAAKRGEVDGIPRDIKLLNFGATASGSPNEIQQQILPVWLRTRDLWNQAIDVWARTTVMDTDTEGWELIRLAYFGELNPQGRTDSLYGPVNARWRAIWKRHKMAYRCNVIAISQSKDEYKKGPGDKKAEATGRTVRAGQKEIPFMADVIIETDKSFNPETGQMEFGATIRKGWYNGAAEGIRYTGADCTFANFMWAITGHDPSEWS